MPEPLSEIRKQLFSAVVCDALDALGFHNQSPNLDWRAYVPPSFETPLVGRCRTTLWADMAHEDSRPYELELKAVDACQPDEVFIAAGASSMRSALWGELLTTAVINGGCVGAIIDGAVRDVKQIAAMNFPVYARGTRVQDSLNRHRVIDLNVPVEIEGVTFAPGDLVIADQDGVVVIPAEVESETLRRAREKVHGESKTREAIRNGMKATEAYQKYGVL